MVAGSQTETRLSAICHKLLGDVNKVANVFLDLFPCCFFLCFFSAEKFNHGGRCHHDHERFDKAQ